MPEPNLDSIQYPKNFLSVVLLRLDYVQILSLIREEPAEFQKSIAANFVLKKVTRQKTQISSGENVIPDEKAEWEFTDKTGFYSLRLTNAEFILQCTRYTKFEDFYKMFEVGFSALMSIYKEFSPTRIGLRYVNDAIFENGNPFALEGYIQPDLLTQLQASFIKKNELTRQIVQTHLLRENYAINFSYGVFNREYPAVVINKEFVLDIDCYAKNPDADKILPSLKLLHGVIQELFENSIGEKYRESVNSLINKT